MLHQRDIMGNGCKFCCDLSQQNRCILCKKDCCSLEITSKLFVCRVIQICCLPADVAQWNYKENIWEASFGKNTLNDSADKSAVSSTPAFLDNKIKSDWIKSLSNLFVSFDLSAKTSVILVNVLILHLFWFRQSCFCLDEGW